MHIPLLSRVPALCQKRTLVDFYSGHMGNGETYLTHSEPQANWQQPTVGSVAEALLEFACRFRPKNARNLS
jgi:hypothetical protein